MRASERARARARDGERKREREKERKSGEGGASEGASERERERKREREQEQERESQKEKERKSETHGANAKQMLRLWFDVSHLGVMAHRMSSSYLRVMSHSVSRFGSSTHMQHKHTHREVFVYSSIPADRNHGFDPGSEFLSKRGLF